MRQELMPKPSQKERAARYQESLDRQLQKAREYEEKMKK
jgi:hypothetical protein